MYIGLIGRCLKQCTNERCHALENWYIGTSTLAVCIFKTGPAVDPSQIMAFYYGDIFLYFPGCRIAMHKYALEQVPGLYRMPSASIT